MTLVLQHRILFITALLAGCGSVSGNSPQGPEAGVKQDPGTKNEAPKPSSEPPRPSAKEVGEAIERGDLEHARKLAARLGTRPEDMLVRARLSRSEGDFEGAIRHLHALTDTVPDFEVDRVLELAHTLAAAERYPEAVEQARLLLEGSAELSAEQRFQIASSRARWLARAEKHTAAIAGFEIAIGLTRRDTRKDTLRLELATALLKSGDKKAARNLLLPMAVNGARAKHMRKAASILEDHGMLPGWSPSERLDRARRFMSLRAWNDAARILEKLADRGGAPIFVEEVAWTEARLLFKRRRHYREALAALEPIAKGEGVHADRARFLAARALSRLDRDEEAIAAYQRYAKRTKNKGRALNAEHNAARLEFYLGRHARALASLEKLVGRGNRPRKGGLADPGQRRDAHFMAGLSALLADKPARAEPHLRAASEGTNHPEVLARNEYWLAVARAALGKPDAAVAFEAICAKDPTAWYARHSARRLAAMETGSAACAIPSIPEAPATAGAGALPMEALSPRAAFVARAGFAREAAELLNQDEESTKVKATSRDWIVTYQLLDAPQHAIRRASIGLDWPPSAEEIWRARAAYPTPFPDLVSQVEERYELPEDLLYAIARKESLFDPRAVSGVGAMGMMQMMPHTYEKNRKAVGLPPLEDGEIPGPDASLRAAGNELRSLLDRFGGQLPLAIMAYNAGVGAVNRWLERSGDLPMDVFVEKASFGQTRNYVRRVFRNLIRYRQLAGQPAPEMPEAAARASDTRQESGAADEDDAPGDEVNEQASDEADGDSATGEERVDD